MLIFHAQRRCQNAIILAPSTISIIELYRIRDNMAMCFNRQTIVASIDHNNNVQKWFSLSRKEYILHVTVFSLSIQWHTWGEQLRCIENAPVEVWCYQTFTKTYASVEFCHLFSQVWLSMIRWNRHLINTYINENPTALINFTIECLLCVVPLFARHVLFFS